MPPLQVDFIGAVKASLETLVSAGHFKRLYTRPLGRNQAPQFPYLELRLGADDSYLPKSKSGYGQWEVNSRVLVIIAAAEVDKSQIDDLAYLIHTVRSQLVKDAPAFENKSITITSMAQPQDPEISGLIGDLLGTVLEIRYYGIETYYAQ